MPRKKAIESINDVVVGSPQKEQRSFIFVGGLVLTGIIVMTVAVYIGKSDSGPINVSATIQESNKTAESEGREQVQVTSPALQNLPNGGLVASENQEVVPPVQNEEQVIDTASTTATSTEEAVAEADTTNDSTETIEEGGEVSTE